MSVAPESKKPVAFVRSTPCCRVWLSGLLGNVRIDMSRVGLKLELGFKLFSLDVLILLIVPHRHKDIIQPGGGLS